MADNDLFDDRLGGSTRYETSVLIAEYAVEAGILTWDKVAIATGTNYPDALAGAALQGADGAVLLLVASGHEDAIDAIGEAADSITSVRILGGTSAVSEDLEASLISALGWSEYSSTVIDELA